MIDITIRLSQHTIHIYRRKIQHAMVCTIYVNGNAVWSVTEKAK